MGLDFLSNIPQGAGFNSIARGQAHQKQHSADQQKQQKPTVLSTFFSSPLRNEALERLATAPRGVLPCWNRTHLLREVTEIVQYGQPRSASSFQWYLLCSIARICVARLTAKGFDPRNPPPTVVCQGRRPVWPDKSDWPVAGDHGMDRGTKSFLRRTSPSDR